MLCFVNSEAYNGGEILIFVVPFSRLSTHLGSDGKFGVAFHGWYFKSQFN